MDLEEVVARVKRMRMKSKEYNNDTQHAVNRKYRVENLVLLYNLWYKDNNSIQRKLQF